jgi:5-methylcytosine rRNA methyltransferase NSUN4
MSKKGRRPDFDTYYQDLFESRWEGLKKAMDADPRYTELQQGLLKPYYLDAASLFPVQALNVEQAKNILDLCAAPGGKALAIAGNMGPEANLTVNDRSSQRRSRLRRVLDEHLASDALSRITVTAHDASRWGLYEQNLYDRVLADVPCSSERHLVKEPKHLKDWSPARTRHLAMQAYAILAAGFTALKPGGILVYSTCALSPKENDEVIAKLLKRRGDSCRPIMTGSETGEATEYGRIILPDRANGMGPIYYASVAKNEAF